MGTPASLQDIQASVGLFGTSNTLIVMPFEAIAAWEGIFVYWSTPSATLQLHSLEIQRERAIE